MKVTLRQRKKGNNISLYLDYYERGVREYEYLNLYIIPDPVKGSLTKAQKEENKKILELAESIRSQRYLEAKNNIFGFANKDKSKGSFITYFEMLKEKQIDSDGNYGTWKSVYKHLNEFSPKDISFDRVTKSWLEGFKNYLDKEVKTKTNEGLSLNSKYTYFNKMIAAIKQAHKDGLLSHDVSKEVEPFPQDEVQREFLTLEELQRMAAAHCKNNTLKRMFLFSCLTGLRWGDIEKLTWKEIQHSNELGYYIRFRQAKTNGVETQPISDEARDFLGEQGDLEEQVFKGLTYGNWNKTWLRDWLDNAGITKHITFHCGRHTYATLQLTFDTDIYTVSKLLGHKNISTTEIYAKIVNEKKVIAANKIKISL